MTDASAGHAGTPRRIMLVYWGRRGLTQFVHELAAAGMQASGIDCRLLVSRQNEEFERFLEFGDAVLPVDTFDSGIGAVSRSWRIPGLRRTLSRAVRDHAVDTVVTLMPHVWSPFVSGVVRAMGARYLTVIHDGRVHPGDRTGIAQRLLLRDARNADRVVTLSHIVRDQLIERGVTDPGRIVPLFHPRLHFGARNAAAAPRPEGGGLRLLFLGRIMSYKGLLRLIDAVEALRRGGLAATLSVMGAGPLGDLAPRLDQLGARVVNRWLTNQEIADALAEHDAVVAPHTEASQSGVVAAALGAGLPVVTMPVGGLTEQVVDGRTGVVARGTNSSDLADAIARLARTGGLYERITAGIAETAASQSMAAFLARIAALGHTPVTARPSPNGDPA